MTSLMYHFRCNTDRCVCALLVEINGLREVTAAGFVRGIGALVMANAAFQGGH